MEDFAYLEKVMLKRVARKKLKDINFNCKHLLYALSFIISLMLFVIKRLTT